MMTEESPSTLRVAVVGCLHGELERAYQSIEAVERIHGRKTDLVVCCGDFQSLRNEADLDSLSCPDKYKAMGSFHKYYSGQLQAPASTVFIGGNHEASGLLHSLPHGGFVAPNIFYLGHSGVVRFGGLRIGGVSGIYKAHDYEKGRFESPPFDSQTLRSVYHIRSFDVFRLQQLRQPLDLFLSHDWPQGVSSFGDTQRLVRLKSRADDMLREIRQNTLGSPPLAALLHSLRPSYWFAAHLH
ncbi:MAG: lariat debranching enzyme, partial [archaeon]|nr:lariat debranching enzyme [archaeon]